MKKLGILFCVMIIAFTGCSDSAQTIPENALSIYYTNVQSTKLIPVIYEPKETEPTMLAMELLGELSDGQTDDASSVMGSRYEANSVELFGSILRVYLEGSRAGQSYGSFLLTLDSLTRTLTQIDGVDALIVYLNGENITDANGKPFGILKETSFTNNANYDEERYQETEVELFFANETNNKLVEVTRKMLHTNGVSPERYVAAAVMAGPMSGEGYPVFPSDVTILSLFVREGICYINFDETLYTSIGSYNAETAIFAMVNSLTMLDGIEKVQFSVNGSTDVRLGISKVYISEPFSYNSDIVSIVE